MLGGIISMVSFVSTAGMGTGGTFGNILFQLDQQGVFAYLLPFLMIFLVLYGILNKINIFKNNAIHVILSLIVALMSLQLNFVSYFFQQIFPRMGVLLSIILVVMILVGMFWNFEKSKNARFIMGALMVIGVIVIVFQSFGSSFWFGGIGSGWAITYWLQNNLGIVLIFVLTAVAIAAPLIKKKNGSGDDAKKAAKKAARTAKLQTIFDDLTQDYDSN
jgi:cation transport ATPase